MSRFKNTTTGDVFHVPDSLDGMYGSRPEFVPYDEFAVPAVPAATAPAGATGDPVPVFDSAKPLAAGVVVALDNVEEIKGAALEETLATLGLDASGTADEKRARIADRLNEEVSRG